MALQDRKVLEPPPQGGAPPRPPPAPFCWAVMAGSVAMLLLDGTLARDVYFHDVLVGRLPPGALFGPLVTEGEWWRVLWTVLEHGGPIHLVFNMSVVFTLGQALERSIGTWRIVLVSLITALGSSAFVLMFAYFQPTVGASGMIIGWLGAILPIATQAGRRQLVTWLVQIAVISLIPGVSWQGHLGGFLFGLPAGLALRAREKFLFLAPILLFVTVVITFLAGSGRLIFGAP